MYGLYVHIPYCRQKCFYCDFVSRQVDDTLPQYLRALHAEMKRYAGKEIGTVFVGGGTPTMLSSEAIKEIFTRIGENFTSAPAEVTMEANPESLSEEKLMAMRTAGVNRLSIGVQSLTDKELVWLGRVHTVEHFRRALQLARKYHYDNINLDFIYGLPGQSLVQWKRNLETALTFHPEHLSLYPLAVEPHTPLHARGVSVDDNAQAAMYEWSMEFLASAGYEHYEISNWCKPGFSSRHNMIYWQNQEYIGIGAAAASFMDARRWKNPSNLETYIRRVEDGADLAEEVEQIDADKRLSEEMILKLRCSAGLAMTPEIEQKYGAAIEGFINQHLMSKSGENIRLTRRGMLLANRVLKEFV